MKNTFRSIGAVLAGIVVVFALSSLTDVILEKTGLMKIPFADNPLWVMILVTVYRNIYVVAGACLAARLAPGKPMMHALIYGAIGFVLGTLGAIVMWDVPPRWYPIALIVLGMPCAWLGGRLEVQRQARA